MSGRWRSIGLFLIVLPLCAPQPVWPEPPEGLDHYTAGVLLLEQGRLRDAIAELRLAVRQDPEFADAHAKLADACLGLGTIEGRRLAVDEYQLAIRRDPHNADYHLALGRVHLAQSFDRYAEECFLEAIEADPGRPEAYLACGRLYVQRWRTREGDLKEAHAVFLRAYENGAADRALLLCLAQTSNELGQWDLAEAVAERILLGDPSDAEARFQYARSLQGQQKLDEAEAAYLVAICGAGDEEKVAFLGVEDVAPADLVRVIKRADADTIASLVQRFWRTHDPNLGTRVNERLLEHWRRVLEADFSFSAPGIGLAGRETARGKSYIRYGPPAARFSSVDETRRPLRWDEIAPRVPGSYIHNFTWEVEINPRPVEIWTYEIRGQMFILTFRDRFLDDQFDFAFDLGRESAERWEAFVREVPQFYVPEHRGKQIRMLADACAFFRNPGSTRLEICFAIPARDLHFEEREGSWLGVLSGQIVIYDQDWRVVAEDRTRFLTEVSGTLDNLRSGTLVHQRPFDLEPGRYLAAIAAEDSASNLMGLAEVDIAARRFDLPGVQLSDIQLARSIRPSDGSGPFDKGNLGIEPEPSHCFRRSRPVNVYYEVYGLGLDERGRSSFRVTVRAVPIAVDRETGLLAGLRRLVGGRPGTPPHIASTFTYEREASSVPLHLALDLGPLRPGRYDLSVEVEDLVTGTATSRSTDLRIFP